MQAPQLCLHQHWQEAWIKLIPLSLISPCFVLRENNCLLLQAVPEIFISEAGEGSASSKDNAQAVRVNPLLEIAKKQKQAKQEKEKERKRKERQILATGKERQILFS